jgi:hypothetical protein
MAAMHFPVKVGSERRRAACYWARPPAAEEVNRLRSWRGGASARGQDAAEFARFAAVKWEMTCEFGTVASSQAELDAAIRADPKIEVTAMLLAEAEWFEPSLLGVGIFHRTWAGNVFLDYLAAHPDTARAEMHVSGVGIGLLYHLCEVTRHLRAGLLWGETTALSAPSYRGYFQLPEETDRLVVMPAQQELFRRSVRDRWERSSQT